MMHTLKAAARLALGSFVFMMLGIGAAWAPGSIKLDEVMEHLKGNEKLLSEITAELKVQNLKADSIICVGGRFGGKWTELGGARGVPYDCEIGKRKLNIDGTVLIYDKDGKELDMEDDKSPERAVEYKEKVATWKWD
jgi:hypothetical protein